MTMTITPILKEEVNKPKLAALDCGGSRGDGPFCLAFLYTPNETRLYKGRRKNIIEQTRHLPLCHGVIIAFGSLQRVKNVHLFGKGAHYINANSGRVCLVHVNRKDTIKYGAYHHLQNHPELSNRKKWFLTVHLPKVKEDIVIKVWRDMPKTYTNDFAEAEQFWQAFMDANS